jgi:hypothetical protein
MEQSRSSPASRIRRAHARAAYADALLAMEGAMAERSEVLSRSVAICTTKRARLVRASRCRPRVKRC